VSNATWQRGEGRLARIVWTDGNVGRLGNFGGWIDCNTEDQACLVSAAPELLAALELYRKAGIGNSTCFETQAQAANAARAAIAKARGA